MLAIYHWYCLRHTIYIFVPSDLIRRDSDLRYAPP